MQALDEDRLIAALRQHGIHYLAEGHAIDANIVSEPLTPPELLRGLAACADPRVRNASIAALAPS